MAHQSSVVYSQQAMSGQDDASANGRRGEPRSKGTTPRFEQASLRSHREPIEASERTAKKLNMRLHATESALLTPAAGPNLLQRETPMKQNLKNTNIAAGWTVKHDERMHDESTMRKKGEQDKKFEGDMKKLATKRFGQQWYLKPDDFSRSMMGY